MQRPGDLPQSSPSSIAKAPGWLGPAFELVVLEVDDERCARCPCEVTGGGNGGNARHPSVDQVRAEGPRACDGLGSEARATERVAKQLDSVRHVEPFSN